MDGVIDVFGDMCQFGMTQTEESGEQAILKFIRFMFDSSQNAEISSATCKGDHRHITLIGSSTRRAHVYPTPLCECIVMGMLDQMAVDNRLGRDPACFVAVDEDGYIGNRDIDSPV